MTTKRPAGLAIFRAGQHVARDGQSYTFSEADLQAIVEGYDPKLAEAPLVVGHPSVDAPAYGWAKSLRAEGGVLYAEPHQVEPQFAQLVNDGRLKKISASIYLPDTPGNPTPGKPYLRHIGFLGAQAPAVKGLPSAQFGDDGSAPEFAMPMGALGSMLRDLFQRLRDTFVAKEGVEAADQVIPQWAINNLADLATDDGYPTPAFSEATTTTTETEMEKNESSAAEFAEREKQIGQRNTELDEREKRLAERETQARRQDAADFAQALVKDGKLLPRHKAPIVELLMTLPADASLEFSEAEGQAPVKKAAGATLREFLSGLPRQVDFSEKSRAEVDNGGTAAADFAAPTGEKVDAGRLAIHNKALEHQRQNPKVGYLDAVRAVGG